MQKLPKLLSDKLLHRKEAGLLRELPEISGLIDFASNDYLGLSKNKDLYYAAHRYIISNNYIANGATGSRLITGNTVLYNKTEEYIAQFHSAESALLFNSGYDANIGFFSAVPQKGDIILYDAYIHASIRDGIKLSNAQSYKFPHNNLQALKTLIERHLAKATEVYVVTESVFSMDGDSPDMKVLSEYADTYGIRLVIDEAHTVGIFGDNGGGLLQEIKLCKKVFARIITFGKALGCHGATIVGSKELKDFLINFARSFIYTTGLSPHSVATILQVYNYLEKNVVVKNKLHDNIQSFIAKSKQLALPFIPSISAIQCIIIPGNEKVKATANYLQKQGYDVRAILSPTVTKGQERLRFCLHSYNTEEQINEALNSLKVSF